MLYTREIQLLFTLLENEAISLDYAALISGYDAKYPGDLVESIGQTGIEIQYIDIEGFDAEGNPITTHAVLLPYSEHTKVAAVIHNSIKHLLEKIDPEEAYGEQKLINPRYAGDSSLGEVNKYVNA